MNKSRSCFLISVHDTLFVEDLASNISEEMKVLGDFLDSLFPIKCGVGWPHESFFERKTHFLEI